MFESNPSALSQIKGMTLVMAYRNQWPGAGDYITYDASLLTNFPDTKSFAGISLSQDVQGKGAITQTQAYLMYSYKTRIGHRTNFAAGLSGGYDFLSVNTNKLSFENPADLPSSLSSKKGFFDFSTGFQIGFLDQTYFGIAASHILKTVSNNRPLKMSIYYQGDYLIWGNPNYEYVKASPLILVSKQAEFNDILYGSRFNFNGILGGLYLRHDFKFKPKSIIILLGINFKNVRFIYTYDINLSGAASNFTNLAAHEVTFFYNFEYKEKMRRKGAIKCPRI